MRAASDKPKRRPAREPFDPQSDSLAARLAEGLAQVALVLRARAWQQAGSRALTPSQGQMLAWLLRHGASGLTLGALARALAITSATASDTLSALERKRLVQKRRDALDARALAVVLTARGRRAALQAQSWSDFLAERLEVLDNDEQQVVLRALVKLLGAMQAHGEIPVARVCTSCRFFRAHAHADAQRPHHCDFVDAPFGERSLRVACPEHEPANAQVAAAALQALGPTRRQA
jgi:DNA-binding MarR family transcriptional regulator